MLSINIDLVLLVTLFAWHYSLLCGYISDDHSAVAQRKDIIPDDEKKDRGESYWVKVFNDGPIMYYQTRLFWKLGIKNMPFFWHLFSLSVHIVNTYLVYLVFGKFFGYEVSLYASAFWAVNPMLNQNVVWISGRPYLFGAFFGLMALLTWDNPIAFLLFYSIGLITNLSVAFIPIIGYSFRPGEWQSILYIVSMFTVGSFIVIWKFNHRFTKGLVIDRDNFNFKLRKINTFARMVLYYVWTLFVPVRMGWYHQSGFRYNEKWEKFNYLTLLGYILIILLLCLKHPGWLFLLALLPNANLYSTNSFLQDRYLYLCSIGIALIVSPYLLKYPELFYCVMTFYITRTYMYSRHLKNDEKLYRENWRNHPNSDYAINNLSYFLIQQRRYDEARVIIEQGIEINQTNRMLWYNLGITYAAQGHFGNDEGKYKFIKAVECWKKCLALEPRWMKPAEDLKRVIDLLVKNKVLSIEKNENSPHGMSITVPNIIGMKEIMDGERAGTSTNEVKEVVSS